uniref:MADS-box domain-containing protein n=1 Tax=Arabis nemorensis TaxID=586526 RepID=A0A565B4Q4_9BRAS
MPKKKLDLTYISDDTSRKLTFKRRKRGFMKKLDEFKDLCNVDSCAIMYSPFDTNPDVWPSNLEEVTNLLKKFEMLSESEKLHKSVNLEGFINHDITKGEKKNKRMMNENKESFMKELMLGYLGGNMGDLSMDDNIRRDLCKFIDQYLMNLIHHKNVNLKNPNFEVGESSSMAMAADMALTSMDGVMAPPAMTEVGSSSFMSPPTLNTPWLTDELQAMISSYQMQKHIHPLAKNSLDVPISNSPQPTNNFQSIMSSNQIPEHVNSLGGNILNAPKFNYHLLTNELQAMISSYQRPEHVKSLANNFSDAPIFNSPQPTNELQSLISSYQRQEHVNSLAKTSQNTPIINSPQLRNELVPIISSSKGSEQFNVLASNLLPNSKDEVYIPVTSQDEFYNPHQYQDQQQELVEEMLKLGEQTGFPWMDDNHQF